MGRAEELFRQAEEEGLAFIERLIGEEQSEEVYLDYKRVTDNGDSRQLDVKDRQNLAKAITGFGTTRGGLIIWGVDCRRGNTGADIPKKKYPITKVTRFVSWLEGAISECTDPPHDGVRTIAVKKENSDDGYAVTFIPHSDKAPLKCLVGKYAHRYYGRAGSNFAPLSHEALAALFRGTQPPELDLLFEMRGSSGTSNPSVDVCFRIRNDGKGKADGLYVSVDHFQTPGYACRIEPLEPDKYNREKGWTMRHDRNSSFSFVAAPHISLPPGTSLSLKVISLDFTPPFEENLIIEGHYGASQYSASRYKIEAAKEIAQRVYETLSDPTLIGSDRLKQLVETELLRISIGTDDRVE
jgi:hypothetical protein